MPALPIKIHRFRLTFRHGNPTPQQLNELRQIESVNVVTVCGSTVLVRAARERLSSVDQTDWAVELLEDTEYSYLGHNKKQ